MCHMSHEIRNIPDIRLHESETHTLPDSHPDGMDILADMIVDRILQEQSRGNNGKSISDN